MESLSLSHKSHYLSQRNFFNVFLHQKSIFTKTPSMRLWELDFSTSYSNDQWIKAMASTYKTTKSANLWELYQKLLLRWYLTPTRIVSFTPHAYPLCWRNCGNRGSIIHIFEIVQHCDLYGLPYIAQ